MKTSLLLFLISFTLRIHRIEKGNFVIWDEAHFGKFSEKYLQREFYFDVHPPLGKMLTAFSGLIFGQKGKFDFTSKEKFPDGFDYVGMRRFHAFIASFLPLFGYLTLKLFFSKRRAFLFSLLFVFENGNISISRLILLDSHLLAFTSACVYLTARAFIKNRNLLPERQETSNKTLIYLGICLGAVMSVKWIGCLTMSHIGVYIVFDLFLKICDKRCSIRYFVLYFLKRVVFLIMIPALIYISLFYIHFRVCNKSGSDDGFMSSEFQLSLENNMFDGIKKYVTFGKQVAIKNANGYLHSHIHKYPDVFRSANYDQNNIDNHNINDQDNIDSHNANDDQNNIGIHNVNDQNNIDGHNANDDQNNIGIHNVNDQNIIKNQRNVNDQNNIGNYNANDQNNIGSDDGDDQLISDNDDRNPDNNTINNDKELNINSINNQNNIDDKNNIINDNDESKQTKIIQDEQTKAKNEQNYDKAEKKTNNNFDFLQITTYSHKDKNNNYYLQKVTEDKNVDFLRDGDKVAILHSETKAHLFITENEAFQTEGLLVTGSRKKLTTHGIWEIEISYDSVKKEKNVKAISTSFYIKIYVNNELFYLTSTGNRYPSWGFNQGEVMASKTKTNGSLWNIEENFFSDLENPPYKELKPSFFRRFIEYHKIMFRTNKSFVQDSDLEPARIISKPYEWIFLTRGIRMSQWHSDYKFYMFMNPLILYSTTLCLFLSPIIIFIKIIASSRKMNLIRFRKNDSQIEMVNKSVVENLINNDDLTEEVSLTRCRSLVRCEGVDEQVQDSPDSLHIEKYKKDLFFLYLSLVGWAFHYLPFFLVGRVLYLHHYFPALFYATLNLCWVFKSVSFRNSCIFVGLCITIFVLYSPLTYGFLDPKNLQFLKVFSSWDFTDE